MANNRATKSGFAAEAQRKVRTASSVPFRVPVVIADAEPCRISLGKVGKCVPSLQRYQIYDYVLFLLKFYFISKGKLTLIYF